jgi:hypothetical protein
VQPDVIYARFLASHLPEPEQAISGWANELEAGGLLLVEEVDSISTEVAAFDEYLKIVSELLAQHGNELFVGARLGRTRWVAELCIQENRVVEVSPSTSQAARMFSMNLPNLAHDPYVEAAYPAETLRGLASELDRLAAIQETGRIVWEMRQISLLQKGKHNLSRK